MKDTAPKTPELAPALDWAALVFRPLVIGGMVTCIAAGWVMSLESFMLDWNGRYLIPLVALVTLETLLVEQRLRAHHLYRTHQFQIRLAEIGLMLVLLKPATYFSRGWVAFLADSRRWLYQPSSFVDADYVIGAVALLLFWPLAMDIAGLLAALDDSYARQDRAEGVRELKKRFMLGTFVLLTAVGLQRLDLSRVGLVMRPAQVSTLTWLPLIYFWLGLLLFGQARLALLKSGWEREQVPIAPNLDRRWAGWSLLFVGGVTALALLMPAGDTLVGFYIWTWLLMLLALAGQAIFVILSLLLALFLAPCFLLFQVRQAQTWQPSIPPLPPLPQQMSGPAWFLYLRLTLFWIVVAIVLFFLVRIYWRDRSAQKSWGIWRALHGLWQALWDRLLRYKSQAAIRFRRSAEKRASPAVEPAGWRRWRARTDREQVFRFYLTVLGRAAQAGHPRRLYQTPLEYAADLEPHLAEEKEALETLTGAFVQARYSLRTFQPEQVSFLRRVWRRLLSALRRL